MLVGIPASASNFRLTSRDYPVEVVAADPVLGQNALKVIERTFRVFAQRTGNTTLEPARFRFILRDPSQASEADEAASYPRRVALNPFPQFTASNTGWGYREEILVRTAMIMQMEAYALLESRQAPLGDSLPDPPLWLVEGLTQAALPERKYWLERIILRLAQTERGAELAQLQAWTELSQHRLEQYWQQAQCYWAVERATQTEADRERLRHWLANWLQPRITPFWAHSPESETWWREAISTARPRKQIPIVKPGETASLIAKSTSFRARPAGDKTSVVYNLRHLPATPSDFADAKDLQALAVELLRLQSVSNFLWKDVIEGYRAAFAAWLDGRYVDYLRLIGQAERQQDELEAFLNAVRDHLNWFEVNFVVEGTRPAVLLDARVLSADEAIPPAKRDRIATTLLSLERGLPPAGFE